MPGIAITRSYEAMYIVDPDLNSEQVAAITGRYRQIVETTGGKVDKIEVWERRKLAYEIKGHTEGIYVVMYFQSEAPAEAELRRVFQISEDQFRYIIVKPGEEAQGGVTPAVPERESRPAAPVQAAGALHEPVSLPESTEPAAPIGEAEEIAIEPIATTDEPAAEPVAV